MLKIQMLEQIMNNDNSDDDECEKSQVDSGNMDYMSSSTSMKTQSRRWVDFFFFSLIFFRRHDRLLFSAYIIALENVKVAEAREAAKKKLLIGIKPLSLVWLIVISALLTGSV